jgi:lycopene cyclase domain-containing protein
MHIKRFYYLGSLFFVFLLPMLVEGYFIWPQLDVQQLSIFVVSVTILGGIWDVWATRHGKKDTTWLWQFHKENTLGIMFFDLPIEELLFYTVSSTYVVFLWEGIKYGQESGSLLMLFVLSSVGIWSLLGILIPYVLRAKKDKVL